MKTTKAKPSAAHSKKQVPAKATKSKPAAKKASDEMVSPYVDLDKADFTERPYHRPSSMGPDHEPGVIV